MMKIRKQKRQKSAKNIIKKYHKDIIKKYLKASQIENRMKLFRN